MTAARTVRFEADDGDHGRRLDQVLAARVPDLSRRKARVLLDIGGVFVDRARVKVASRKIRRGQVIEAHIGGALERATPAVGRNARDRDAAALPRFSIAYEDGDIVIVDKPAGLLTAPTPESDRGNLADMLTRRARRRARGRDAPRIYVVHRIDLHTSGLLVFAKTRRANRELSARFRDHDIRREYIAVVAGAVAEDGHGETVTVREPIAGRDAVTHLTVSERLGDRATVLRARLETGRTHQIRIHAAHIGHPVLGDPAYGSRTAAVLAARPPRMALHAAVLDLEHPRTGAPITRESPLPGDLAEWLDELRTGIELPSEES